MSDYSLRPHHGLCIAFFEGKGYSEGFTKNMYSVIEALERDDPYINFTSGSDNICKSCPNNANDKCVSHEKVSRYDKAVVEHCGYNEDDKIKWSVLKSELYEKIIAAGKLNEICSDCMWREICASKAEIKV